MTQPELEAYITKLLPSLRKKHVRTDDDDNACQVALLDLYRKCDTLQASSDAQFITLFCQYYNQERKHVRYWKYRAALWAVSGNPTGTATFETDKPVKAVFHSIIRSIPRLDDHDWVMTDPWHNTRTEALEYLELIPNTRIRKIAFQYYILGYTLAEIGAEHGISYEQVRRLLTQGVNQIKETIAGL